MKYIHLTHIKSKRKQARHARVSRYRYTARYTYICRHVAPQPAITNKKDRHTGNYRRLYFRRGQRSGKTTHVSDDEPGEDLVQELRFIATHPRKPTVYIYPGLVDPYV